MLAAGPVFVGSTDCRGQHRAHDGDLGRRVPGAWPGRVPAAYLQGSHPCPPGACLPATESRGKMFSHLKTSSSLHHRLPDVA